MVNGNHKATGRHPEVMVIGIDGATFDVLEPWLAAGRLPALAALIERGSSGILDSTTPPLSPVAWTTFMTGAGPGKHGIYDFVTPKNQTGEVRLTNRLDCRIKPIWRFLNEAGYTAGMVNIPMTFPPEKLDGYMVSGMDSPSTKADFTYPPELKQEINWAVGGEYIIEIAHSQKLRDDTEAHVQAMINMVASRLKTSKHLMANRPCDFFMVVFTASDRGQHYLWKYHDKDHPEYEPGHEDALYRIFKAIDEAVGELTASLDERTDLFIMSDHGFAAMHTTVNLNRWLLEEGFLALKGKGIGSSIIDKVLSPRVARRFKRLVTKSNDWNFNRFADALDPVGTKAFFIGAYSKLFINTEGRFPFGSVKPGTEYEQVRSELIARLRRLKDPKSRECIVDSVATREEAYQGEQLDHAPDLIVNWKPGYSSIVGRDELEMGVLPRSVFGTHMISGDHDPHGIFVAVSPRVAPGRKNLQAQIADLAPTILHAMGLQVPAHMDGKVMTQIFTDDFLAERPVSYRNDAGTGLNESAGGQAYTEEEAKMIEERLQDLGYLE